MSRGRNQNGVHLAVILCVVAGLHAGGIEAWDWYERTFPDPVAPPVPEEVEITWIETPPSTHVDLPDPEAKLDVKDTPEDDTVPKDETKKTEPLDRKIAKLPEPPKPKKLLEPPKPKVKPPEPPKPPPPKIAKVQPPKPPPPKPPPPKPQVKPPEPPKVAKAEPQKPKPPPPPPPMERKKKVIVDDDKSVVEEDNLEAKYYSDKNRKVAEETRARDTNLEKANKGQTPPSEQSDDTTSPEIGGKKTIIAQREDSKASSLDAKRKDETSHSGKAKVAKGVLIGDGGQAGEGGGRGGDGAQAGPLAMRNIEGTGAPGNLPKIDVKPGAGADDAPLVAMSTDPGRPGVKGLKADEGKGPREGTPGKPGQVGPRLRLDVSDYARIVGNDKLKEDLEVARRTKSMRQGRWEKKLARVRQSLENFTPEVRPGNQTALGTRAHPFAVYIASMHNRVHELWGFGFLSELDLKSPSNPMNKRDLEVKMEIVINADGTIEKVTIVKGSGVLPFDVAAIDTVYAAGPYGDTPQAIRSGNGKAYLHWTFHRDERQCNHYFADPFILDNAGQAPSQDRGLPDPADAIAERKREQLRRAQPATDGSQLVPRVSAEQHQKLMEGASDTAAAARAEANLPTPDDPKAGDAALAWANGYEKGDAAALVAASRLPFRSSGTVVAKDEAELQTVWQNIVGEASSRRVKEWKVMSAAGYRAAFGRLPAGAEDGTATLFLVLRMGKDEVVTVELAQEADGSYKAAAFTR